jgi:site-specific DNA recombinase
MKSYFAYIRVSTVKQGEHGSSLQEQRAAIEQFAARNQLTIVRWFEERETAAKVGRHEFNRMLSAIKKERISGVIFHKIDRSARNLKDWSVIQDLADRNIDVRFTQESINLTSNEGKLTGDFLAVISSHYIRNLREEVKKGMRGRLRQGLYPLGAPVGYLDRGGGKAKVFDPLQSPHVRDAFTLYATGNYALRELGDTLYVRGLRSRSGKKVHINSLAKMLRNPFYIGIIRMKRSGETYQGIHEPLISPALFNRVQRVFKGKSRSKVIMHDFLFRRFITCAHCRFSLIGERQKTYTYYRCHTKGCPTRSLRQESIEVAIDQSIKPFRYTSDELADLRNRALRFVSNSEDQQKERLQAVELQSKAVNSRLSRLMDVYLEGGIERSLFEEKKLALLVEQRMFEERRSQIATGQDFVQQDLMKYLELLEILSLSYETAIPSEKRDLIKSVTSNLFADRKYVVVELRSPFLEMANLASVPTGGLDRDRPRTFVANVFKVLQKHAEAANDNIPSSPKRDYRSTECAAS